MTDLSRPLLLVDDEGAFRRAVAEYLATSGFSVTQASTVAEAIEQLEGFAFDVVLTDLRLPDGEGTAVMRPLSPAEAVIPVMGESAVTAGQANTDLSQRPRAAADRAEWPRTS